MIFLLAYLVFLYLTWIILTKNMKGTQIGQTVAEKQPFWKHPIWPIVGGISIVICALIGGFLAINGWYNSLPQMIFQQQAISSNSTPNSCTLQAYSNICPYTLNNNETSSVYLENVGNNPAYFYVNFTIHNLTGLTYYTYSHEVNGGQPTYFTFFPEITNKTSKSFSIVINATCKSDGLLSYCKGAPQVVQICNYQKSNYSQSATLKSTPVNNPLN